jgi:hypothetical protein
MALTFCGWSRSQRVFLLQVLSCETQVNSCVGLSGKDCGADDIFPARHDAKALVTILIWAHGGAAASSVLAASPGAFTGGTAPGGSLQACRRCFR